jgi:hypothetical protein
MFHPPKPPPEEPPDSIEPEQEPPDDEEDKAPLWEPPDPWRLPQREPPGAPPPSGAP